MRRRKQESIFYELLDLPWWISLIVAGAAFLLLRYLIPALALASSPSSIVAVASKAAAPYVAVMIALFAPAAFVRQLSRRLLDTQADLDSLRAMSWKDFELLVGEGFRRLGS